MKSKLYFLLCAVGFWISGCGEVQTEVPGQGIDSSVNSTNETDTSVVTGIDGSGVIAGIVTFDRVHPNSNGQGLDYENITREPARQVVVKLIDSSNNILLETTTDAEGAYRFGSVPENSPVKVRVYAQMSKESGHGTWDVSVMDNTNGDALYVFEGNLVSNGTKSTQRNLHASSGWDSSFRDYVNQQRVAAPFAILDSIYTGMKKILATDSDANFPQLSVYWSYNNVASGNGSPAELRDGLIVTSHYNGDGGFYILGDKDSDTDEYDHHIIIHEWSHYFEDNFSRADNIGGSHSNGERLDIRVAFGEGWANAYSAIATDDPIYFDTLGSRQSRGWSMNIESQTKAVPGWYSEASIQRIIYDLYDNNSDGMDQLSLGFEPIYNVLVGKQKNTPAFTSIFSFITALKSENSQESSRINNIVSSESINPITEIYGSTHHDLYSDMRIGDRHQVCTSTQYGKSNKLNNRKYIRLTLPSNGRYTIRVEQNNGNSTDPDFYLYRTSPFKMTSYSDEISYRVEEESYQLTAGDYLLDIADYNDVNNACFTVTVN